MALHRWPALLAALALLTGSGHASLVLYEGFDYGPQDDSTKFLRGVNDHNGGTGWADEWKAVSGDPENTGGIRLDKTVVTQSYPAGTTLTSSGSRVENDFGAGASNRALATTIPLATSGTDYFFSALVNWSPNRGFSAEFQRADGLTRWTAFDIDSNGQVRTGINGLSLSSVSLTAGIEYLLVGRLERNVSGGDDRASLSVFEVSNPGSFLTEPVAWDISQTSLSGVTLALFQLSIDAGNPSGDAAIIDEIRVGTTYADVVGMAAAVPEASEAVVILLGLCGMAGHRRRRRRR